MKYTENSEEEEECPPIGKLDTPCGHKRETDSPPKSLREPDDMKYLQEIINQDEKYINEKRTDEETWDTPRINPLDDGNGPNCKGRSCVRITKRPKKCKNDQHHRGQKESVTTSAIVKDAPTECDAAVALPCKTEGGCARHRLFWAFKEQRIMEVRQLWSHTEQQKAISQKANQEDLGIK